MTYVFDFNVVWANSGKLIGGLALGLALALVSIAIGVAIGLAGGFAATGHRKLARNVVAAYVAAIRNTPLLVIVLVVYFALPDLGVVLGKYESFIASLALYAGAYLTEVFRASLSGIPSGLID